MIHTSRVRVLFCLVLAAFAFATIASGQDSITLSKPELTLTKNGSDTIEIRGSLPIALESVTWEGEGDYLTIQKGVSGDAVVLTISARKATDRRLLNIRIGDQSRSIVYAVRPTIEASELKLDFDPAVAIKVVQDQEVIVRRKASAAGTIEDGLVKVAVQPESAALAFFQNNVLTIRGKQPGSGVRIVLTGDAGELATVLVDVREGYQGVSQKELVIDQGTTDAKFDDLGLVLLGKNNGRFSLKDNAVCTMDSVDFAVVSANCEKISAQRPGPSYLLVHNGEFVYPVKVTVSQKKESVKISSLNNPDLQLSFAHKSLDLQASVFDISGSPMVNQQVLLDWTKTGTGAEDITMDIDNARNIATLRAPELPTNRQTITVTACLHGSTTACHSVNVAIQEHKEVTNFRLLRVRFDIMDDQTAKDLFGRKAVDEYFIAKVRLFNAIRKGDEDFGNSILVYSESLEAKVAVEFKQEKGEWMTLTEAYAKRRWFPNDITNPITDDSGTNRRCESIKQTNFFVPYRPLTFEMVANTQDRRNERSGRSRLLLIMNGASSLASIVTSIAVPGPSSDLPLGLDKFRNLAIPAFEKLFPSMNEVQRQNIISMVMKPLEEIPFGSDITRVVFFPKRAMQGVIVSGDELQSDPTQAVKLQLRISGIAIADACAQAAVIKKTSTP